MSDTDDHKLQLYRAEHNKLAIHDIRAHDLHVYVHELDVEPAKFHHHHGPEGSYDILYHKHDGPLTHGHYLYNPLNVGGSDYYRNGHHGHPFNHNNDGGATEHGA